MDKSDRSRRGRIILAIFVVLSIGGVIAGVIIWNEGKISHVQQKDPSLFNINSTVNSAVKTANDEILTTSTLESDMHMEFTGTMKESEISWTSATTSKSPIESASKTRSLPSSTSLASQATATSSCENPKVRKEWRDLSDQEQSDFLNAVNEMFKKPSRKGFDNLQMDFVKTHIDYKNEIHNSTVFLLWHRHFIFEYEKELQAINPSVSLPYWDWGMDYENPAYSPLFGQDAFGGTGDNSTTCIKSGKFIGIQTQFNEEENSPHCVQRVFGSSGNVTTLPPPSLMMGYALLKNFSKFTHAFESYPHALAHNFVGGDMITNHSPSDPIFFLVHANVDRYFYIWQRENPDQEYPGNLEDKLPSYEIPLSVAFQSPKETSDYCYSYSYKSTLNKRKKDFRRKKDSKNNLTYPSRVPSQFTRMMGGNPKMVQKLEDDAINFIDCLNNEGFESPAASYSLDRNWKNHNIRHGSSRFEKNSKSRNQLEICLNLLEGTLEIK